MNRHTPDFKKPKITIPVRQVYGLYVLHVLIMRLSNPQYSSYLQPVCARLPLKAIFPINAYNRSHTVC